MSEPTARPGPADDPYGFFAPPRPAGGPAQPVPYGAVGPVPHPYESLNASPAHRGPDETKRTWLGTSKKAAGPAAAGAGAAAKGGLFKMLFGLKALAFLVKFKVAASMAISVAAYAFIFGWWYAVGFVALIAVHEIGHVIVLRAQGVKVSAPTFIPFMGAFVTMKEMPRSVTQESIGALAGPGFGLAASLATYALSQAFDSRLLQALAFAGFFLNLFNLLPMLPLDGGRIAGALHPAVWWVGMAGALAVLYFMPSPVLVFVLFLGVVEMVRRWRERRNGEAGSYYEVEPNVRLAIGVTYAAVALTCLWGIHVTYIPR
ncbi:site-2 protease family protein [Angustibacter sp. McL0619]|uniref:site-2 protease family protein n=1 Tax=Angustibacter sp. McL0619 TaxID=3415676 RepID=UPI003CE7500B